MNIRATYDRKPIPDRSYDWSAIDEDTYGGEPNDPIGYGPTREAAIADLTEQMEERGLYRAASALDDRHAIPFRNNTAVREGSRYGRHATRDLISGRV